MLLCNILWEHPTCSKQPFTNNVNQQTSAEGGDFHESASQHPSGYLAIPASATSLVLVTYT